MSENAFRLFSLLDKMVLSTTITYCQRQFHFVEELFHFVPSNSYFIAKIKKYDQKTVIQSRVSEICSTVSYVWYVPVQYSTCADCEVKRETHLIQM